MVTVTTSKQNDYLQSERTFATQVVFVIFISTVLELFSIYTIVPLFPSIIQYYYEHDRNGMLNVFQNITTYLRHEIGASELPYLNVVLIGGLLHSLTNIIEFVCTPVALILSNYYGRKKIMIICLISTSISHLLWAFSKNFNIFLISRILFGLSRGTSYLRWAIISDVTTIKQRDIPFNNQETAKNLSYTLGPLFGAGFVFMLRENTYNFFAAPAIFAFILTLLHVIYIIVFLKESLPETKLSKNFYKNFKKTHEFVSPLALLQFRLSLKRLEKSDIETLQKISIVHLFFVTICSGMEFILPFLVHNRFNFECLNQGLMFLFIGITCIVTSIFVKAIVSESEKSIAVGSMLITMLAFFIIAFSQTVPSFYIGLFFFATGTALVRPALFSLITKSVNENKFNLLQVFECQKAMAYTIGPLFASIIFWNTGNQITFTLGGIFLLSAITLLSTHKHISIES